MNLPEEIESPTGLDLNPKPPSPVRLSKRAGILALVVVFAVAAMIGYGIVSRRQRSLQSVFQASESKGMTAATDAGKVIAAQVPNRPAVAGATLAPPGALQPVEELQPPGAVPVPAQARAVSAPPPTSPVQYREPTPEEKRLALAYERELEAINAPTTAREAFASRDGGRVAQGPELAALMQALRAGQAPASRPAAAGDDVQAQREEFLEKSRAGGASNYLASARVKPVGRYEIKAGWGIPAILEQSLNSDLPGEIRALVRENVYDTASGNYLLIPQGSRLVGLYNSRVAFGQDGVQVVWNRIIFPDASSINLDGMAGQDAKGNAGLRHEVDNHYRRLIGFGVLTSLFSAGFQLSQPRTSALYGYPSAGQVAAGAVGQQLSQLGADVTRRNLNVPPTIKVPVGYRFNVRANRDIVFEAPYRPMRL